MLYKANNNNVNWREKVRNFFKFYNTYFVFVKDIPAELDLWERYQKESKESKVFSILADEVKEFKGNHPSTVNDTLDAFNELNPYSYPISI